MLLKRFSSFTLFFSLSVAFLSSADAQSSPLSAEAKQNAEALLKQMTLDEKIGQLNQSAGIVMPGIAEKKPPRSFVKGDVHISTQPVDQLQKHAPFGLDDAFHHEFSSGIHYSYRKGCSFLERLSQALQKPAIQRSDPIRCRPKVICPTSRLTAIKWIKLPMCDCRGGDYAATCHVLSCPDRGKVAFEDSQ
jgi:hypothetical protein